MEEEAKAIGEGGRTRLLESRPLRPQRMQGDGGAGLRAGGPKTLDAGLAMVTVGMAWWYRAYSREQTAEERGQYEFAETEAKAKGIGLWRDEEPVPPWNWRQMVRTERH